MIYWIALAVVIVVCGTDYIREYMEYSMHPEKVKEFLKING